MSQSVDRETEESTAEPTIEESDTSSVSRDDAFEVLSNQRRRYVLHYLQQNGNSASLSDVAEQVAAWENETTVSRVSASERKTVYTSLQQFHFPKLDDKGVVEFERRAGEVQLTDAAADLDIYLELVDGYDVPWSSYYLLLSGIGVVVTGLALAGVRPFAAVPSLGWTAFLLVAFGLSSLAHHAVSRRMRLGADSAPPEVNNA